MDIARASNVLGLTYRRFVGATEEELAEGRREVRRVARRRSAPLHEDRTSALPEPERTEARAAYEAVQEARKVFLSFLDDQGLLCDTEAVARAHKRFRLTPLEAEPRRHAFRSVWVRADELLRSAREGRQHRVEATARLVTLCRTCRGRGFPTEEAPPCVSCGAEGNIVFAHHGKLVPELCQTCLGDTVAPDDDTPLCAPCEGAGLCTFQVRRTLEFDPRTPERTVLDTVRFEPDVSSRYETLRFVLRIGDEVDSRW